MKILTFAFVILFGASIEAETDRIKNGDDYVITKFQKNSGIYYEYHSNLRLSTSNWRVTIFHDIKKQVDWITNFGNNYQKLLESCPMQEDWCPSLVKNYNWDDSWEMAKEVKDEILSQKADLMKIKSITPFKLPKSNRNKRSAPLLGFIGKILGPVAGVLSYDDGEQIDNSIRKLSTDQSNLTFLVAKQTHVVKAIIDDLYLGAKIHDQKIEVLSNYLIEFTKSIKGKLLDPAQRKYSETLLEILKTMKLELLHYIKSANKMVQIIRDAKKGQLHSSLISESQLMQIVRDIQDKHPGAILPVQGPAVSMEEIIKISRTSVLLDDNYLEIFVDIPLADVTMYRVHKIHSLPVFQPILNNETGRASVVSEYTHVALDESQKTYILFKGNDLQSCIKTPNYLLCNQGLIVYEAWDNPPCEVQLLLNPTLEVLRSCKIQLDYHDQPYWVKLETSGGWLYSVGEDTMLNIHCPSKIRDKVQLSGAGLLQLTAECQARTASITLPAVVTTQGISEIMYKDLIDYSSEVELILPKLSPYISNVSSLESNLAKLTFRKTGIRTDSTFLRNSETLEQLEQQLYELSVQTKVPNKRSTSAESIGLYLGSSSIVIVAIVILYCFVRNCNWQFPKFSKRDKGNDTSAFVVPTPTPRQKLTHSPIRMLNNNNNNLSKNIQSASGGSISIPLEGFQFDKAAVYWPSVRSDSRTIRTIQPIECLI